mmetsp:Transcript_5344/g.6162  ORF Transcript_5344/g.6162 Transcript_5344/m.6162 type:complete len:227 (+) Transcript_5344:132-812(+)
MKETGSVWRWILCFLLLPYKINSFVFHDGGSYSTKHKHGTRQFALADPPVAPTEFQDEEESINENSDWLPTNGGFVANFRTKTERRKKSNRICFVDTIEDYKNTVVDESTCIVVVRFYASWCRSCKASEPLFKRMANSYESDVVKFVEVPLTKETAYIQEGLGVPSVPYGHIYHPQVGLVEEMKISKPNFRGFRNVLQTYVAGSCELNSDDNSRNKLDERGIGEFE